MLDYLIKKNSIVDKKDIKLARRASNHDFKELIQKLGEEKKEQDVAKFNKIKAKVLTMGRISRMLKNAKDNSEQIEIAKASTHDGKLPQGMLSKSLKDCKDDVEQFVALHKIDSQNEKFPI